MVIYLHGSVEHYTDQNRLEEVQRLDDDLVVNLTPLLRDHPLVVIGYRGAEPSIMQHLLGDQAHRTNLFRRGIYWCILANDRVHQSVIGLADRLSGNLQLVQIAGFDETMDALSATCAALPDRVQISARQSELNDSQVRFDMKIVNADLKELDWGRIELQISAYCRKMQIEVPTNIGREWLLARMEALDLIRQTELGFRPHERGVPTIRPKTDDPNTIGRLYPRPLRRAGTRSRGWFVELDGYVN